MQQETSQELLRGECHLSVFIAVSIIFPAKGNLVMLEGQQAVVGDGDAMGVAGEIAQHMMGSAEGWLGIDDPVLTEQGTQEGAENFLILQGLENSAELELALLKSSLQSGYELTAKDPTQHSYGKEEGIAGMDPLGVIGGQTAGWDEAVDVGMMQQVLAPGMEDRKETDLCAQVARVHGYLEEGLRTGAEQEVVEDLLVLQRQWG